MQALGIFLIVWSIYLVYSGATSIRPIKVLRAIIGNPNEASEIIAGAVAYAKATGAQPSEPRESSGGSFAGDSFGNYAVGSNPFSGFPVTAPYGQMNHSGTFGGVHMHQGTDYGTPSGTPLPSLISGKFSEMSSGMAGNIAQVSGTGEFSAWRVQYMHCRSFMATDGATVSAGQNIALSGGGAGDPGRGDATGPHVHVQVWHNGSVVDPQKFFLWASANKANIVKPPRGASLAGDK